MEGNIVGGQYVSIYTAPYSVFISINSPGRLEEWFCGGSVLNHLLLLTAAHCLDNLDKGGKVDIIAGHHNIKKATVIRRAHRYVPHSKFKRSKGHCDIALIMLKLKLPLRTNIQRVIIRPYFPQDTRGQVSGWGLPHAFADDVSAKLKMVNQKLLDINMCANYRKTALHESMMCATSGFSGSYPMSGDSGSALVVTEDYQQIGIVSFSFKSKQEVIIYTNVSYFYHWILLNSRKLYCKGK